MGTRFRIVLYAVDEESATTAARDAFDRVDALNGILSHYDRDSELRELCRSAGKGEYVGVSDELWFVLKRSIDLSRQTDGAFDVTVGPLVRLWHHSKVRGKLPTNERLASAKATMGFEFVRLDPREQSVELVRAKMMLDMGAIAKGYVADEALATLNQHRITSALIDAGGDLVLGDAPPGRDGWRIGIAPLDANAPPSRFLIVSNVAIATSGDAFQHVVIDGKRYSHIINPRTGLGLSDQSSVTVIARDGITADALASAVSVLGPVKGSKLVDNTPGAAAHIVRAPGGRVEQFESRRFGQLKVVAAP